MFLTVGSTLPRFVLVTGHHVFFPRRRTYWGSYLKHRRSCSGHVGPAAGCCLRVLLSELCALWSRQGWWCESGVWHRCKVPLQGAAVNVVLLQGAAAGVLIRCKLPLQSAASGCCC